MGTGIRTIADLEREAKQLGVMEKVVPTKNSAGGVKKVSKNDIILALRDYHLNKRYPDGKIPKHLQLMLEIDSPMLANRYTELKPEDQKSLWESDEWGFQEKMDGLRLLRVYVRGEGVHYYSRGVSVKDYLPIEYTNIYQPNFNVREIDTQFESYIADNELVCTNPVISTVMKKHGGVQTDTQLAAVSALLGLNDVDSIAIQTREGCPLKFFCFDTLYFNGQWLIEGSTRPLIQTDREKVARIIVSIEKSSGLNVEFLETVYDTVGKKDFYEKIIAGKGEGVIAKLKKALYLAQQSRSRCKWIKIKRTVSGSLTDTALNDTVDAFLSGWERGEPGKAYENMVGTLKFSVWLVKQNGEKVEHCIGNVCGLDLKFRKEITILKEDGTPDIRPDMLGKVAEIDGQNMSSRALRIRHCRLIRWRDDKSSDACQMEEQFLKDMVF